ncbi:MAG: hypothetical protein ACRC5C_14640, partial [Bacilli bacterium]
MYFTFFMQTNVNINGTILLADHQYSAHSSDFLVLCGLNAIEPSVKISRYIEMNSIVETEKSRARAQFEENPNKNVTSTYRGVMHAFGENYKPTAKKVFHTFTAYAAKDLPEYGVKALEQ